MKCLKCGMELTEASKFCPKCGMAVGELYSPAVDVFDSNKANEKTQAQAEKIAEPTPEEKQEISKIFTSSLKLVILTVVLFTVVEFISAMFGFITSAFYADLGEAVLIRIPQYALLIVILVKAIKFTVSASQLVKYKGQAIVALVLSLFTITLAFFGSLGVADTATELISTACKLIA